MTPSCACTLLPDDTSGKDLAELPIAATLDALPGGDAYVRFHRCRVCGTLWQQSWEPFMHVDVEFVARTRAGADGKPVNVVFDPRTGATRVR